MSADIKVGVYQIKNLENGRIYVGASSNIRARWLGHRSQLNNSLRGNPGLQSDWSAIGEGKFEFSVLEDVSDAAQLVPCEQRWMDSLGACQTGYNRQPIASIGGPKTSAEMREALRLVMTGMTGREAAKKAGVREESLYRRVEYKEWKSKQRVKNEQAT